MAALYGYCAYGLEQNGLGDVTYPIPDQTSGSGSRAIQNGDGYYLAVTTSGNTPALPSAAWEYVATAGAGTSEGANGLRLTVMRLKTPYAGEGGVTILDCGNHQNGHTFAIGPGTPGAAVNVQLLELFENGPSGTAMGFPALATPVGPDALVVCIAAGKVLSGSWQGSTSFANPDLTNIGQYDQYFGAVGNVGTGSTFSGFCGRRTTAGTVQATAENWQTTMSSRCAMTFALVESTAPLTGDGTFSGAAGTFAATAGQPVEGDGAFSGAAGTFAGTDDAALTGTGGFSGATGTFAGTGDVAVPSAGLAVESATVKQRIMVTAPGTGTWTTDSIATSSGALLLAGITRGFHASAAGAEPKGPTLASGGTPTLIGQNSYIGYPPAKAGLWYVAQAAANATNTASATFGEYDGNPGSGGDEVTIPFLSLTGVKILEQSTFVERSSASSVTGLAVKASNRAIYVSVIYGNGPTGMLHGFVPSGAPAGATWVRVDAASALGDPSLQGYIQVAVAVLIDSTGALAGQNVNCTWTNSNGGSEGGQIYNMAFVDETGVVGDGAFSGAAGSFFGTGDGAAGLTGDGGFSGAASSFAGDGGPAMTGDGAFTGAVGVFAGTGSGPVLGDGGFANAPGALVGDGVVTVASLEGDGAFSGAPSAVAATVDVGEPPAVDAVPFVSIEDAIHAWFVAGSRLPATKVIWSDQNGRTPANPYIALQLSEGERFGQDWIDVEDNPDPSPGNEILHVARGPRVLTLTATCFSDAATGAARPMAILANVVASLRLPSRRDALNEANVGVFDADDIRSISGRINSTVIEPRAILTARLHTISEVSESGTYISRVQVENADSGEDFEIG